MRKNHFVDHLMAGVFGEKPDVLIRPAITPDILPEVFHIPPEQMIIPSSQFELPTAGAAAYTETSAETDEQEIQKKLQMNSNNNSDDQEQSENVVNEDNKTAKDKADLENPELIKSNTRTMIEKKIESKTIKAAESTVAGTSSSSTDDNNNNNNVTASMSGIKDKLRKKKIKESLLPLPSQSPQEQPPQSDSSVANTTKKVHADKKEIHENQILYDKTNVREEERQHNTLYEGRFPSENIKTEDLIIEPSPSPAIIPDKFVKGDEEGRTLHSTTSIKKTSSPPHSSSSSGDKVLLYRSEPTVTINIGRIEVRAISSQQKQQSSTKIQQEKQKRPSLSLKEYLKQRSEGTL